MLAYPRNPCGCGYLGPRVDFGSFGGVLLHGEGLCCPVLQRTMTICAVDEAGLSKGASSCGEGAAHSVGERAVETQGSPEIAATDCSRRCSSASLRLPATQSRNSTSLSCRRIPLTQSPITPQFHRVIHGFNNTRLKGVIPLPEPEKFQTSRLDLHAALDVTSPVVFNSSRQAAESVAFRSRFLLGSSLARGGRYCHFVSGPEKCELRLGLAEELQRSPLGMRSSVCSKKCPSCIVEIMCTFGGEAVFVREEGAVGLYIAVDRGELAETCGAAVCGSEPSPFPANGSRYTYLFVCRVEHPLLCRATLYPGSVISPGKNRLYFALTLWGGQVIVYRVAFNYTEAAAPREFRPISRVSCSVIYRSPLSTLRPVFSQVDSTEIVQPLPKDPETGEELAQGQEYQTLCIFSSVSPLNLFLFRGHDVYKVCLGSASASGGGPDSLVCSDFGHHLPFSAVARGPTPHSILLATEREVMLYDVRNLASPVWTLRHNLRDGAAPFLLAAEPLPDACILEREGEFDWSGWGEGEGAGRPGRPKHRKRQQTLSRAKRVLLQGFGEGGYEEVPVVLDPPGEGGRSSAARWGNNFSLVIVSNGEECVSFVIGCGGETSGLVFSLPRLIHEELRVPLPGGLLLALTRPEGEVITLNQVGRMRRNIIGAASADWSREFLVRDGITGVCASPGGSVRVLFQHETNLLLSKDLNVVYAPPSEGTATGRGDDGSIDSDDDSVVERLAKAFRDSQANQSRLRATEELVIHSPAERVHTRLRRLPGHTILEAQTLFTTTASELLPRVSGGEKLSPAQPVTAKQLKMEFAAAPINPHLFQAAKDAILSDTSLPSDITVSAHQRLRAMRRRAVVYRPPRPAPSTPSPEPAIAKRASTRESGLRESAAAMPRIDSKVVVPSASAAVAGILASVASRSGSAGHQASREGVIRTPAPEVERSAFAQTREGVPEARQPQKPQKSQQSGPLADAFPATSARDSSRAKSVPSASSSDAKARLAAILGTVRSAAPPGVVSGAQSQRSGAVKEKGAHQPASGSGAPASREAQASAPSASQPGAAEQQKGALAALLRQMQEKAKAGAKAGAKGPAKPSSRYSESQRYTAEYSQDDD